MPTLAGHQSHTLDAEYPGDGLELRHQRLELQIDQVRATQVNGVAMLTAHFAAGDVDAVSHQQLEDVAQDTDAVLAMDFDTHEGLANVASISDWAEFIVKNTLQRKR